MRLFIAAAAAIALSIPAVAADQTVTLSGDNTKITWVGTKGAAGKHDGGFKTVTGTATVSGDALTAVKVEIDTASL
jgi:polyisoprenoid-binding protein YceI